MTRSAPSLFLILVAALAAAGLFLCSFAIAADGPTTNPSPLAVGQCKQESDAAGSRLKAAKDALQIAKDDAHERFSTDPQTIRLNAEIAAAQKQHDMATDSVDRMNAGANWNKLRFDLAQRELDFLKSDALVVKAIADANKASDQAADATKNYQTAKQALDEFQAAEEAAAISRDPIRTAIRDKVLCVGMTFEQAKQAAGEQYEKTGSAGDVDFYDWGSTYVDQHGVTRGYKTWSATFRANKLISFERIRSY